MTLQAGVTMFGRRLAESLQTDMTCVVDRVTGRTFNETTGQYTATYTTQYTGGCRVRFPTETVFSVNVADQQVAKQNPVVSLPMVGSDTVRAGDRFTVSTSTLDTAVVGLTGLLEPASAGTAVTARRFTLDVTNG